jgi:hypothetical protein
VGTSARTDADNLVRSYATAAAGSLVGVLNDAAADLGLERTEDVARLMRALSSAFVEGIRVGESEMLAQAIEQGMDVTVNHVRPTSAAG